jgi:lysophospholipase L1-like esterase
MESAHRSDLVIGAVVLAVLGALVGLGVANRSTATASGTAGPSAVGAPAPTTAPTGLSAGGTPTSTVAPTTTAAPTTTVAPTTTTTTAPTGPVTAVGDSIMLDIQPYLAADLPGSHIDGLVSRQFQSGIAVVAADRAAGTLGDVLVVELGTNGAVTAADIDAMMQAAAGVHRVVFVNVDVPRAWEAPDNAALAAGVARYPGLAVLADWYTLSSPHPEWFTTDQVHLNPAGAQALATLITQSV